MEIGEGFDQHWHLDFVFHTCEGEHDKFPAASSWTSFASRRPPSTTRSAPFPKPGMSSFLSSRNYVRLAHFLATVERDSCALFSLRNGDQSQRIGYSGFKSQKEWG